VTCWKLGLCAELLAPKILGCRAKEIWGPWLVSTGRNWEMRFRLLIHTLPSYGKWLVSAHLFMVLSEAVN
jgi:hypothetical protein